MITNLWVSRWQSCSKVWFILSLKSNSAVEPDCLISALLEVNALNVNALLLATIRLDPAWGCPHSSLRSRTSRFYTSKYCPSLMWSWMGASKQYLFAGKVAVLPLDLCGYVHTVCCVAFPTSFWLAQGSLLCMQFSYFLSTQGGFIL